MGPITTCGLLNDNGSPASETFVLSFPLNYFNCSHNLVTDSGQVARELQTLPAAQSGLLCASLTATPEVSNLFLYAFNSYSKAL